MEASSSGRPIITTNVPGCRDAIINNLTGLLVPVCNSKSLSEAIINLLNFSIVLERDPQGRDDGMTPAWSGYWIIN